MQGVLLTSQDEQVGITEPRETTATERDSLCSVFLERRDDFETRESLTRSDMTDQEGVNKHMDDMQETYRKP